MEPLTVGFELEFSSLRSDENTIGACYRGKPLFGFNRWKFRTDSSCGYEINSPVIRDQSMLEADIAFIDTWMRVAKAESNAKCGFHVHVGGLQQYPPAALHNVIRYFSRYEDAFFALVEPDRRDNEYCAPITSHTRSLAVASDRLEDFIGVSGFWRERRCWLNGQSLSKHHTLELRLPEGTTDADRIRGWVNLFLVCIEGVLTAYSKNPVRSVRTAFKSHTDCKPLLVHDMLTAAGTYGAAAKRKIGWGDATCARKFVARRFRELHGVSYRTEVDRAGRARAAKCAPSPSYGGRDCQYFEADR